MKKIYYELEPGEWCEIYTELPECFGCDWIVAEELPYTSEDCESEDIESIEKMIENGHTEECTEKDYEYVMEWAEIWGIC